jgi:glycosyltransferase involved in cell wall biosynthesis
MYSFFSRLQPKCDTLQQHKNYVHMKVFIYPVSTKSIYVPLTLRGVEDRYQYLLGAAGTIDQAIDHAKSHKQALLHVQWEEFLFKESRSPEDADAAFARFEEKLRIFAALGGRTVLTIHNELPHKIRFHHHFLRARQAAADASQAIIVHSSTAARVLSGQIKVNEAKIRLLPHPSYIGHYEEEDVARQGLGTPSNGTILGFGAMRPQKGFARLVKMLPAAFLYEIGARLRISGEGRHAPKIRESCGDRSDVFWDIRYVPGAEVASLIRSAACVALVYERFLTSGVAHLVISVGGLYVAPDVPQHRELLPPINHRFLFREGDAADFRRAIRIATTLSAVERRLAMEANFEAALGLRPETIATRLAALYDTITG